MKPHEPVVGNSHFSETSDIERAKARKTEPLGTALCQSAAV